MPKEQPNYQDAELTLKIYDLRRESKMREARDAMAGKFWPKSYEEFFAVTKFDHPMNAAFRQFSTYWEMVYSFAKHGIMNGDFLVENNGEGIFFYAKILPYLERFRKEYSPTAFQNTEWVVTHTAAGQQRLEILKSRVAQLAASMK